MTFLTLPRAESNSQEVPLQSSFIEFQARPEDDGTLSNTWLDDFWLNSLEIQVMKG
ncbi:hypothetical protein BJX64DRAFT_246949 [Aspergillus heterothallicus]